MRTIFKVNVFLLLTLLLSVGCSKDKSDSLDENKKQEQQNSELNGIWEINENCKIKIDGKQAIFVVYNTEFAKLKGLDKFIKVGDVAIKDLVKIEENKWTGKEIICYYIESTKEVTRIDYSLSTFTLNAEKNKLTSKNDQIGSTTYYKVTL